MGHTFAVLTCTNPSGLQVAANGTGPAFSPSLGQKIIQRSGIEKADAK